MASLTKAERFADLIVDVGANVQAGQEVEILADLGTEEASAQSRVPPIAAAHASSTSGGGMRS